MRSALLVGTLMKTETPSPATVDEHAPSPFRSGDGAWWQHCFHLILRTQACHSGITIDMNQFRIFTHGKTKSSSFNFESPYTYDSSTQHAMPSFVSHAKSVLHSKETRSCRLFHL
jgi:hypothetical protein